MPIRPNFSRGDIERRLLKFMDTVDKKLIQRLQYLGELCVKEARLNHTYTDQSGNLTASIGYVVFKDGKVIHENYESGNRSAEGTKAGKVLAEQVASNFPKGYLLVVTAGMNYALKVESKGYNVLTTAEQLAKDELPNMLESLKSSATRI